MQNKSQFLQTLTAAAADGVGRDDERVRRLLTEQEVNFTSGGSYAQNTGATHSMGTGSDFGQGSGYFSQGAGETYGQGGWEAPGSRPK
jgi:hypothetical protein